MHHALFDNKCQLKRIVIFPVVSSVLESTVLLYFTLSTPFLLINSSNFVTTGLGNDTVSHDYDTSKVIERPWDRN